MRYFIGDTETTGMGEGSQVVEISWLEVDDDFNVVDRQYSLIKPTVPIQYGAMAVHGIREEDVKDAPSIEEFMAGAGASLAAPDAVLVAHNAPFDIRYFAPFMAEDKTICTLRCARILYPEAENHKLTTLKFWLGLNGEHDRAHTADEDVAVLFEFVKRMCHDHDLDLSDLFEVQARKRKVEKMTFGKHKGTLLKDLPKTYVSWLLKEATNLDVDLRASLEAL